MMTPLYDWFGKRSYAQSGEDLIADSELGRGSSGVYVDVGAYHPKLFSNTYLFYKKGWKGICIDPSPSVSDLFRRVRPRDIFLNVGVGGVNKVMDSRLRENDRVKSGIETKLEYFMFEDGAANTFSVDEAKQNQGVGRKLVETRKVEIVPLKKILDKHIDKNKKIDLLSVDAEGMDEEVLRSNDWEKYRPKMVICEDLSFDYKNWKKSGVVSFLEGQGYKLKAMTPYSLIFKDKNI